MKTIRERIDNLKELNPEVVVERAVRVSWDIGYCEGTRDALDRIRMVAATIPKSVTKQRLIDMLKREIEGAEKAALEVTR